MIVFGDVSVAWVTFVVQLGTMVGAVHLAIWFARGRFH